MEDFLPATTLRTGPQNTTWPSDTYPAPPPPEEWTPHPLAKLADSLWFFCLPVILILGTFGCAMTIIIMQRMTTGESCINVYFTALAITDLVGLYSISLIQWLMHVLGFRLNATHSVVCKVHAWVYIGASTIGCWFLVCMTVHRAMSVVWPHRVNVMCTRRTVLLLLVGITVFFAGLYSHYMVGFERIYSPRDNKYWCTIRPDNIGYIRFTQNVFVYVQLSVYSLLPFITLAVANSILVWKLAVSVKAASRHLTQEVSGQLQAREKVANSITLTVIVVSLAFLVLTLPISVNYILNYLILSQQKASEHEQAKAALTNAVTGLLGQTNYVVNFYLYCLTGRRFREEFVDVVCCRRSRRAASSLTESGSK